MSSSNTKPTKSNGLFILAAYVILFGRCPNMAVMQADEEDGLDEEIAAPVADIKKTVKQHKTHKCKKQKVMQQRVK